MRFTTLPPCPHCRAQASVYVAGRAAGIVYLWFSCADGLLTGAEPGANGVAYLRGRRVLCAHCEAERTDLRYVPARSGCPSMWRPHQPVSAGSRLARCCRSTGRRA